MILKYEFNIDKTAIQINLRRLTNQIYKLLPLREEGGEWRKPLSTVLEEFSGMDRLFLDQQPMLYKLTCKLEGLFTLDHEDDFLLYRGIIFECLGIVAELTQWLDQTI